MSDDLIARIRAAIDEDERRARAADDGHGWVAESGLYGPSVRVGLAEEAVWSREVNHQVWTCEDEADGCPDVSRAWMAEGTHMARHDPAHVLAMVEAHRKILDAHPAYTREGHRPWCGTCDDQTQDYPCETVSALAAAYDLTPAVGE